MRTPLVLLVVSAVVGALCTAHLWRRQAPVWKRLLWTVVVFIPAIGPLLYGGLFEVPSVQPEADRVQPTPAATESLGLHR